MQLAPYEEHFRPEQIAVVVLEELLRDKATAIRRILEHIGCDPGYLPRNLDEHANKTEARGSGSRAIRAIQGNRLYQRVQYRLPQRLKRPLVRALEGRRRALPSPSPETVRWIADGVREDTESLREFLGREEPIWDLGAETRS